MSVIDSTNQAAAVGVGAKIVQFGEAGGNLISKVNVIAVYDPAKTSVVDEVPIQILNAADAGDRFGFGWPLHRLIKKVFKGSQGAGEVWATPQAETTTQSAGEVEWTGATTAAGTVYLRLGNELYAVDIPSGSSIEETSDAVVAFVNAVADTPVVASKTAVTFETVFTAKAKGLEGDNMPITINADVAANEALPTGLTTVITAMTGGAGTPDIDDALNGMGTGDDVNQLNFSHIVHGYGLVTAELDKIGIYVGLGDAFNGCYSKLVNRPFVSLNADTDTGAAALTALQVITDARLSDRANGILGCPDEDEIPTELAAEATGIMARMAQNVPGENYTGQPLTGVGKRSTSANRWTKDYSGGREVAVDNGISPSRVISEQLYLQNIITFFRPANIPSESNGYRSFRSIMVLRNINNDLRATFESTDWQGISIVADSSEVTDFDARQKTRDVLDVRTVLNNRATFYKRKGWIFDAAFSQDNSTVSLRAGGTGFDIDFKWKMSGEAQIYNIQSSFDINIT